MGWNQPGPTRRHGGILPSANFSLCFLQIIDAKSIGFFKQVTAPQAPKWRVLPHIIDASHSIFPSQDKLEPYPAFVNELFSSTRTAIVTAIRASFDEA